MSIFEAIMLICFGAAWPVNIYKSYKTASAIGKSPFFLLIVIVGYISGITHKILHSPDFVMYLYGLNMLMISIDLAIYFRNRNLDRKRQKENPESIPVPR